MTDPMESKSHKDTAQNRLLIATAVLTFLYFAGAHFTGLSVLGATVSFSNEDAVIEFTWVIWAYYYLRTYQYYKEAGIEASDGALDESYVASIGYLLLGLTPSEFALLPGDDAIKSSVIRIGFRARSSRHRRLELSKPALAEYWHRLDALKARRGRLNLIRKHSAVRRLTLPLRRMLIAFRPTGHDYGFVAIIYPPTDRFTLQGQHKYFVPLPFWIPFRLVSLYLRALLFRPQFTENQGPLILGLAPVWYVIFQRRADLFALGG